MSKLVYKIILCLCLLPEVKALAYFDKPDTNVILTAVALCLSIIAVLIMCFAIIVRHMMKKSRENAFRDVELGIGNRAFFIRRFNSDISDFSRKDYFVAYFVVDNNYFHICSPKLSFEETMQITAKIIRNSAKEYEFAARVTESGFALAFRSGSSEDAKKRIKLLLDKLGESTGMKKNEARGIFKAVVYNLGESDRNGELLLFNLRRNCYSILGREKQLVFCDSHNMNEVLEGQSFADRILKGMEKQEFKLFVQFIVDNKTKQIVSAEGLARWEDPEKGIIAPGGFIGAMTRYGLMSEFDYYMFEQVCMELERWNGTVLKGVSLSCNFSRITLSEENFVERVGKIMEKYSFDRNLLIFEITEETVEKDRETAMRNVKECKKMGISVALDDMGSGYTSLVNLCEYPIDVVKIDREILLRTDKKKGRELLSGIVALAHKLKLKVVCEGVETGNQFEVVCGSECDCTQGWYFSKAIPSGAAEDFWDEFSVA